MPEPKITRRKLKDYQQHATNPNLHNARGLQAIEDNINYNGAGRSGLASKEGVLLAGNGTWEAMARAGIEDVIEVETDGQAWVVVKRSDLGKDDARALSLMIGDNKIQQVDFVQDDELVASLLNQIAAEDARLVQAAGFDDADVRALLDSLTPPVKEDGGAQVDRAEELQAKWLVQPGDLWQIGNHRLLCGDSRNVQDVQRLCNNKIQGAFTSPPYAMQRKDQYGGVPAAEYVDWWDAIQSNIRSVIKPDGSFFVNIKPHTDDGERSLYVMDLVLTMSRKWQWSYVDEFCWLRSGVPREVHYNFKNGFEPVYQFAVTRKGFKFNPDDVRHESESVPIPGGAGVGNTNWAGKQGRKSNYGDAASDLQGHSSWIFGGQEYAPGMAYPSNVLKGFSNDETRGHEAAFPVQLPDFFIRAYSDVGDIWFDPFMGSGTVFVAAEQNSRIAYGMEMKPEYCAIILERLSDLKLKPERLTNGMG